MSASRATRRSRLDAVTLEVEPRQLEQLRDQRLQVFGLAQRDVEVAAPLGRRERPFLQQQRLEVAAQRGQRTAQVMGDVGDQLAPQVDVLLLQPVLQHLHLVERTLQAFGRAGRQLHHGCRDRRVEQRPGVQHRHVADHLAG
jgi:hypothetical protein